MSTAGLRLISNQTPIEVIRQQYSNRPAVGLAIIMMVLQCYIVTALPLQALSVEGGRKAQPCSSDEGRIQLFSSVSLIYQEC